MAVEPDDEIFRRFCELQRALINQIEDDELREEFEAALRRLEDSRRKE